MAEVEAKIEEWAGKDFIFILNDSWNNDRGLLKHWRIAKGGISFVFTAGYNVNIAMHSQNK